MSERIAPTSTTAFDLKQDSGVKFSNDRPRKLSDEVHQNNEIIKTARTLIRRQTIELQVGGVSGSEFGESLLVIRSLLGNVSETKKTMRPMLLCQFTTRELSSLARL